MSDSRENQIGDYAIDREYERSLFNTDKVGGESLNALFTGCEEYMNNRDQKIQQFIDKFPSNQYAKDLHRTDDHYFRLLLLNYIETRQSAFPKYDVQDPDIRATKPEVAAIKLKDLLGDEGLALYQAALEEEANDRVFRKAVFCKSSQHFEGDDWEERPAVIVSGPSGCGKSYAAKAAVEKTFEFLPQKSKTENPVGNYVVAADGGVVREVSQMRKLMIRLSNEQGYTGVRDLHANSKVLEPIKKHVLQAAIKSPTLGVVIPETFSNWILPTNNLKNMLRELDALSGTRVVFARVNGFSQSIFQKVVAFMGNRRAWKTDFSDNEKYDLNSTKNMAESKNYGANGFMFGLIGSQMAEKWFIKHSKENLRMNITNDLILVKPTDPNNKADSWVEAEQSDDGVMMIPRRLMDDWNKLEEPRPPLDKFFEEHKKDYGPLIKTSVEIEIEICLKQTNQLLLKNDIDNQEKRTVVNSLKDILANMKPLEKKSTDELNEAKEQLIELRQKIAHEKRFLFFETRTQKIFNRAIIAVDEAIKAKQPSAEVNHKSEKDSLHVIKAESAESEINEDTPGKSLN